MTTSTFVHKVLHPIAEEDFNARRAFSRQRFDQDPVGYFGQDGVRLNTKTEGVLALVKKIWTLRDPDAHEHMDQDLMVSSLGTRACGKRVFELRYLGMVLTSGGNGRSPSPPVILTEEELEEAWASSVDVV